MSNEIDEFEERAAILQFDVGMGRFEAEIKAARMFGKERWEIMEGKGE